MKRRRQPGHRDLTLFVDTLSWGGRGVGRADGKVVFVHAAVPGDRLRVRIVRDRSSYSEASILEILDPSPHRVASRCEAFPRCGGCSWLCAVHSKQVQEKEAILRNFLRHHLEGAAVDSPWSPGTDLGYRHRGEFHAAVSENGSIELGFHERGTRRVVALKGCPLFGTAFNETFIALGLVLREHPAIRSLLSVTLAFSESGDHSAGLFRFGRPLSPDEEEALAAGVRGAGLGGLTLHTPGGSYRDIGSPWITYNLPPEVTGRPRTLLLRAHVRSFTQSHLGMNEEMVRTALDWLDPRKGEALLDLYGGIGNFGIPLALRCGSLTSVEGSPTAVEDARENARRAGASNMTHLPGDCSEVLRGLASEGQRFDSILLDPPRTGAGGAVPRIAGLSPRKILYVSCDLPTLARDLGHLRSEGYSLRRVRAFDGFPQTHHMETVCLLTPKNT